MHNDFVCPHCRGYLNARKNIIFIGESGSGERGILLLSPEIGDHSMIKHPSFPLSDGEQVQLFCPICHANLVKRLDDNKLLAKILMIDQKKQEHEIFFSGIIGERSTIKVTDGQAETFGAHVAKYLNFFKPSRPT